MPAVALALHRARRSRSLHRNAPTASASAGVAYCPPELADLAAALGFGAVPLVPYGEEVARLDELLLEGKISQEVYLQQIKTVLKPPQQRS